MNDWGHKRVTMMWKSGESRVLSMMNCLKSGRSTQKSIKPYNSMGLRQRGWEVPDINWWMISHQILIRVLRDRHRNCKHPELVADGSNKIWIKAWTTFQEALTMKVWTWKSRGCRIHSEQIRFSLWIKASLIKKVLPIMTLMNLSKVRQQRGHLWNS